MTSKVRTSQFVSPCLKLLFVYDSPEIGPLIRQLGRMPGSDTVVAKDLDVALDLAPKFDPNAVLAIDCLESDLGSEFCRIFPWTLPAGWAKPVQMSRPD